jgi:hypothetical protein
MEFSLYLAIATQVGMAFLLVVFWLRMNHLERNARALYRGLKELAALMREEIDRAK